MEDENSVEKLAQRFAKYLRSSDVFRNINDMRNPFEILQDDYEVLERELYFFISENRDSVTYRVYVSIPDKRKFIEYSVCIM